MPEFQDEESPITMAQSLPKPKRLHMHDENVIQTSDRAGHTILWQAGR